jgi:hypothetical protein
MIRSILIILTHKYYSTKLPLAFLFIKKIIILLSDFLQVLNSIKKHLTKNEHFSMHILFSTIYLLHEQKLNPNKYFEQEINMGNFTKATEHGMNMHATI